MGFIIFKNLFLLKWWFMSNIMRIFAVVSKYIYMRRTLFILLFMLLLGGISAQEFRCTVTINSDNLTKKTQQYESSDKKVFEHMQQALTDFVNNRRWTNLTMEQYEKLDCSIGLILNERSSATDFKGQLQIQLRRPVFGSNYTTGLFNYMESGNFGFTYNESQPLEFDPGTFYTNLSSAVAYYLYILLGIQFDSFALNGGTPFYDMANTICLTAATMGYPGWDAKSGQKARYWFMENHTNTAYAELREAYYLYHRMGLDMMTINQEEARANIMNALRKLQDVHNKRHNLLSVQQFVDVKIAELVQIFTPASKEEQTEIYRIIKNVSPINVSKLSDWNLS